MGCRPAVWSSRYITKLNKCLPSRSRSRDWLQAGRPAFSSQCRYNLVATSSLAVGITWLLTQTVPGLFLTQQGSFSSAPLYTFTAWCFDILWTLHVFHFVVKDSRTGCEVFPYCGCISVMLLLRCCTRTVREGPLRRGFDPQ